MYIFALDISMSNTGVAVFTDKEILVSLFSIPTNNEDGHGKRLKVIADRLNEARILYPVSEVVMEQGFTKFNKATQVLFRAHGVVNYVFCDVCQTYIPSTKVKQFVAGTGSATKEQVSSILRNFLPKGFEFKNDDESDAFAVGYAYFILRGIERIKDA